MALSNKVDYLRGLADGLKLKEDKDDDKILLAIIDALGEIAETVDDIDLDLDEIADQVDAVDEDLAELESFVYEGPANDDFHCCDDDCCGCDDECLEVVCPNCGEDFMIDFDTYEEGHVLCPECGADLEFDYGELDGIDEIEDEESDN